VAAISSAAFVIVIFSNHRRNIQFDCARFGAMKLRKMSKTAFSTLIIDL
jgi:hypothetical protein